MYLDQERKKLFTFRMFASFLFCFGRRRSRTLLGILDSSRFMQVPTAGTAVAHAARPAMMSGTPETKGNTQPTKPTATKIAPNAISATRDMTPRLAQGTVNSGANSSIVRESLI